MSSKDTVILIHGFAAHRIWMKRLERFFQNAGYQTLNWGYPSVFPSIRVHAKSLMEILKIRDQSKPLSLTHFVTHSMGCIVARAALLEYVPNLCGRWVMLAPPHHGSRAADLLGPLMGWSIRPLNELRTSVDSFVQQLAVPQGIEMGVIAAEKDFLVGLESTKIGGEKDRLMVPSLHSTMLFRSDVAAATRCFLEHGFFHPRTQSQSPAE